MADDPKPAPKLLDNPWVKELIRIGVAVLISWLASKGIKLPAEQAQPVTVTVNAPAEAK